MSHWFGLVQRGHALGQHVDEFLRFLVARARHFVVAVQALLDRAHVGQAQLGLDHLDVGDRVDLAGHVDHVLVIEAAHHVDDGVGFADVREELVAQALALARAGHQARDVDELDDGRHDALGLDDGRQRVEPRVGQLDDAHVRLDRAKGVVLCRDAGLREGIEEGGLAHVGQADDAAFEAHGRGFRRWVARRCSEGAERRDKPTILTCVMSCRLDCRRPPETPASGAERWGAPSHVPGARRGRAIPLPSRRA